MITSFKMKFSNFLNHYSMVKTRQLLLTLDDHTLEQAGISGDMVRAGVKQWPWHIDAADDHAVVAASERTSNPDSSARVANSAKASVRAQSNNSYPADEYGEYIADDTTEKAA